MNASDKQKYINELFQITETSLDIENLKSLVYMFKFSPELKKLFPKGFILADSVNNKTGGILYSKDAELTPEHVERLVRYANQNEDFNTPIKIKKDKNVVEYFKKKIHDDFKKNFETKKVRKEFYRSIKKIEKTFNNFIGDILANDEMIYKLYRARMLTELADESGNPVYYFHTLNVMLYSIEILQNSVFTVGQKFSRQNLINIGISALLHDYGAMENARSINELPIEQRQKAYFEANSDNQYLAQDLSLNAEVGDILKRCSEFNLGNEKSIWDDEKISSYLAHIITIADKIDIRNSGLFGERVPLKKAVDFLYVLAQEKKLKKGFVDSLSKTMNFQDLFDFYYELQKLKKSCLKGNFSAPYPLFGFKSPVLVLCKTRRLDCPYYARNEKSVTLVKSNSGLEPGSYGRCKKLSNDLIKFYQSHYKEIKTDVIERQTDQLQSKNSASK